MRFDLWMVETTQSGIRQRATDDAADTDQPALELAVRRARGTPVKDLCWEGVNEVAVEEVPDPQIINKQDADRRRLISPESQVSGAI